MTDKLIFPDTPTRVLTSSSWFLGAFELTPGGPFDDGGYPFIAAYAIRYKRVPAKLRLGIKCHPSGGWKTVDDAFGVESWSDVELRNQDGQARGSGKAEWWCCSPNGEPYPERRNAEGIRVLKERYPAIDLDDRGIVIWGNSMGGSGINAAMCMPEPYRSKIAYTFGSIGVFMHRLIEAHQPGKYTWPEDDGAHDAFWQAVDFDHLARTDPVIRGIHYRLQFNPNDGYSRGVEGSSQLRWVNILERERIGGAAVWAQAGHAWPERDVKLPKTASLPVAQDVTLDRAHPAFTNSTGNWPLTAAERLDEATYPRGHYNAGLSWDHAKTVDTADVLEIPIRYVASTAMGGGIPDQPKSITVDVTPRRPRNFQISNGDTLRWQFGELSGSIVVVGDWATVSTLPLVSGAPFTTLRLTRA